MSSIQQSSTNAGPNSGLSQDNSGLNRGSGDIHRGGDINRGSGGNIDGSAQQRPIAVQGETAPSVNVQSQLATSTIDSGKPMAASNLGQVVEDLNTVRSAHSGWLESETLKIDQWGKGEISRLLSQTKEIEKRLIAEAQDKQKLMEEEHKAELARMVQKLDADKAKRLKDLEDGMQRQIQAALSSSKKDIAAIESQMNERKMALLSQSQKQTAKDVDRLSNLAVTAKLQPSVTRTTIETNTETGTVVAVATGGEFRTGAAAGETVRSAEIKAVPTAGSVQQSADITTGELRRDDNNRKVGDGAIVNSMTEVNQKPIMREPNLAGGSAAGDSGLRSGPASTTSTATAADGAGSSGNLPPDSSLAGGHVDQARVGPSSTSAVTTGGAGVSGVRSDAAPKKIDAAYGVPLDKSKQRDSSYKTGSATFNKDSSHRDGDRDRNVERPGEKHESHHKEGIFSKMKHAITGEPKSSEAHRNV